MTYHHATLDYIGRELQSIKVYSDSLDLPLNRVVQILYEYNDQGYRVKKTIDIDGEATDTINYRLLDDKVVYETDSTYGIIYSYDVDGTLISFAYDDNINDTNDYYEEFFYITDIQGNISGITDLYGELLIEYKYDAWGNQLSHVVTTNQNKVSKANLVFELNPYTYRGYRYDEETNLYYLNSRYYNPVIGRFINADGLLGETGDILGHNMFAYTQNNPVMYTDPSGESPILIIAAIAVIVSTGIVIATLIIAAFDIHYKNKLADNAATINKDVFSAGSHIYNLAYLDEKAKEYVDNRYVYFTSVTGGISIVGTAMLRNIPFIGSSLSNWLANDIDDINFRAGTNPKSWSNAFEDYTLDNIELQSDEYEKYFYDRI